MNKFIIPIVFIKTEGMKVYMNMQVQIERKWSKATDCYDEKCIKRIFSIENIQE